ncbi:MAG: 16S rRNA (uracil(1498)-N(3))-methyltransferase [Chthoniobacteraceae bacterium]|nr:16S rRNA (uracil(1498)-N(3))-methyltransferase [Chthoniobacteraceae bacterium]
MPRFYIPPARWNAGSLLLDADESHHATGVLRLKTGDRVTVFNGEGEQAAAEIAGGGKRALELRPLEITASPKPSCRITLGQAVPKGKTMDLIVQKATELGASAVVPLLTERTVVQCDARETEKKREKWQTVAVEACKQCGQNWLPAVAAPQSLGELLASAADFDLLLIASLQPDARHPKAVLAEARSEKGGSPQNVLVLVGPEGDFTDAEIALAKARGCRPVTLGPIILRAETAALYCLSVLSYELLGESR